MPNHTRVFISYSHDSEQHLQFVLELAEHLLEDGFNCIFDFYLEETPVEGWRSWLETELAAADFTLVVCTPTYLQHYQNHQAVSTDEATFTGLVITQDLYTAFAKQTKFVPILSMNGKLHDVIPPLQGNNTFELMTDYLSLHQLLRNQLFKRAKIEKQTAWGEYSNETITSHAQLADNKTETSKLFIPKIPPNNKIRLSLLWIAVPILLIAIIALAIYQLI